MTKTTKPAGNFSDLTLVGLTAIQARCYGLLSRGNGLPAGEIAKKLKVSRTNLYVLLEDLQTKGFVTHWKILPPVRYQAVPLALAMAKYADYQRQQVRDLMIAQEAKARK